MSYAPTHFSVSFFTTQAQETRYFNWLVILTAETRAYESIIFPSNEYLPIATTKDTPT